MTWFDQLTGFVETTPEQVRQNFTLSGDNMISHANGRTFIWGQLETPTLAELRQRVASSPNPAGRFSVREIIADVRHLHADESNAGCLFQVASQFNLLEMINPRVTPEQGIGRYETDHTQGPICAIAAGAGTIYRNYFAPVNGKIGQTKENQIDCLADIGAALGNHGQALWVMENGYALASAVGLAAINQRLHAATEAEIDDLRQRLRIGVQWNTQVTLGEATHTVSQAYCSALPVAYSGHSADQWEAFARLVLDAAYEATFCAAILNAEQTGNNRLFLTLLGGGVFGNPSEWIAQSIIRCLQLYAGWNLDVAIVSYGESQPFVRQLVEQFA